MEQEKKCVIWPILWSFSEVEHLRELDHNWEKVTCNEHSGKQANGSVAHIDFRLCSNTKIDCKNPVREHSDYNSLKHSWV